MYIAQIWKAAVQLGQQQQKQQQKQQQQQQMKTGETTEHIRTDKSSKEQDNNVHHTGEGMKAAKNERHIRFAEETMARKPAHTAEQRQVSTSPLEQRRQQVEEMIRHNGQHSCIKISWPSATEKTLQAFIDRNPVFHSFSTNFMASQRRMLFLADVTPEQRFERFEHECYTRQLAPTTAETYWVTWLSVQKMLQIVPSITDDFCLKKLKQRALRYQPDFPTPATLADIEFVVKAYRADCPFCCAVVMATFILGQRISDMIQLDAMCLTVLGNVLKILIRRGKNQDRSVPFTLWLPANEYPATVLIEAKMQALASGRDFLLTSSNNEKEKKLILDRIREMLLSVNEDLELRSIRRGGLQRMAMKGHKLSTILEFSQHADEKTLMRYLDWGTTLTARRDEMLEVTKTVTEDMTL